MARFESEDKYPVDLAVEDRSFPKGATPSNYYTQNWGKRECEFCKDVNSFSQVYGRQ